MKRMENLLKALDSLGLNFGAAIAGAAGGLVAFIGGPGPWWRILPSTIVGALIAGYTSDMVSEAAGISQGMSASVGFLLGLFGKKVVEKITDVVNKVSIADIIKFIKK